MWFMFKLVTYLSKHIVDVLCRRLNNISALTAIFGNNTKELQLFLFENDVHLQHCLFG